MVTDTEVYIIVGTDFYFRKIINYHTKNYE